MTAHEADLPQKALDEAATNESAASEVVARLAEARGETPVYRGPDRRGSDRRETVRSASYSGPDRRRQPTPMLSRWSFRGGRRKAPRRVHEFEGSFVDIYGPGVVALLLFFFALTIFDSVATLVYLGKGGRELNPVAQWMIDQGAMFFVLCKGSLSGLCLAFVVLHKNFKTARFALGLGFVFYLALGLYHLVLQIQAA